MGWKTMSNIKDIYGLTPVQEGIYAQYYRDADTQAYQLRFLLRMSKEADLSLVRESVGFLTLRHEVLKTAFAVSKSTGAVKQVVLQNRTPAFCVLSRHTAFTQKELESILAQDADVTFDLQKDALVAITVIDFTDERYMYVHAHHIILDGWCLPILMQDLERFYTALAAGVDIGALTRMIEEEKLQNTSFAAYVNWLKEQDSKQAVDYWQTLLKGYESDSAFGKTEPDYDDIKTTEIAFSQDLSRGIEAFAKEHMLSLNTVFETVFGLTLQKYKGTNDIVFGTVTSGRNAKLQNISRTLGPFINTIPIRVTGDRDTPILDLLRQMQKQSILSAEQSFLSLAKLFEISGLDKKTIETLFVFENYYLGDLNEATDGLLRLQPLFFKEQTEFPLTVTVTKMDGVFRVRAVSVSAFYTKEHISDLLETMTDSMIRLIGMSKHALSATDAFSSFHALTPGEAKKILRDFNDTSVPFYKEKSIYDLFEEQVKKGVQASIEDCQQIYSFTQLNADASCIDAYIRQTVGTEKQVIGVLCDRSYAEIVAIFGIIRGGNAYLPISPQYPAERIRTMLETGGCRLVLAQKEYVHLTDCAESVESVLAMLTPDKIPAPAARPEDTLYVIYTSGSTGTPKGAMVSNRSAVNRIQWMANRYFDSSTVVMRKTPYIFDVSVWEIFGFAMFGFSLYILPPDAHYNQNAVLAHIEKGQVSDLHFVPTVFEQFLVSLKNTPDAKQKLSSVRHVILSGESLLAKDVNAFRSYHDGHISIHNFYGPAECAVDVTAYDCAETEVDPIPIGRPIANTQIYIVDRYMQPVPIGVTGELCIVGENVGQGYINDRDRTDAVFIDNPFGEGKLYKTGDLACWREDGNIVFVGRNDFQVKINGQRIELGEIENSIVSMDGVTSAAVIVRRNPDRLAAFYTGKETEDAVLRQALRMRLPAYMIPAAFCHLEAMPMNMSGKTDRKALASIEISDADVAHDYEPPANALETQICQAFCAVLNAEQVGRNDSFYDLGGTSLQMIQLLSRAPLDTISPADFMLDPTPKHLALTLDRGEEREYFFLKPLYLPKNSVRAILLFAFGGGDASAYTALTEVFRKHEEGISLWYVPWLEEASFTAAAEEIQNLCKKTEVSFYSHCAGAVTALRLLDILNRDVPQVKQLTAGGNVLPAFGKKPFNIWKRMTDGMIMAFLQKAGLPADKMPADRKREIIARFRKDTNQFFSYAQNKTAPTPVDVHLILSKKDPFTRNYRLAASRWAPYVNRVCSLHFIDSNTHYFQTEQAELLYSDLLQTMKEG